MFALGASHATNGKSDHYMDLGRGVAEVCHESYQRTGMEYGIMTEWNYDCMIIILLYRY